MSIQQVIDRLSAIVDQARAERSRIGYFAALYRRMTQEIQWGINAGEFEDGQLVERLDVAFAERYFVAYDAWRSGLPVTSVWQEAFTAASGTHYLALQHLLLGINAHINLDLGIVTAELVDTAHLPAFKGDFDHVNLLIRRLIDQIQGRINRVSPGFWLVDVLGGELDETLFDFSLERARDSAWDFAVQLSPLAAAERGQAVAARDQEFAEFSRHMLRPGLLSRAVLRAFALLEVKDVVRVLDVLRS